VSDFYFMGAKNHAHPVPGTTPLNNKHTLAQDWDMLVWHDAQAKIPAYGDAGVAVRAKGSLRKYAVTKSGEELIPFRLPPGYQFAGASFNVEKTPSNTPEEPDMSAELVRRIELAKKEWADIALAVKHGRRVLLYGIPGTGKSFIGAHARPAGSELFRLYLTMDTPAAEVRGHYLPNEAGGFSWHDGPGIKAWKTGGRLVIDEIDQASGDTLTLLMGLLDDPESAQLTLPSNETVRPKAGFSIVATTNQKPSIIPEALLDRFDVVMPVTRPCPDAFENGWHVEDIRQAALRSIFLVGADNNANELASKAKAVKGRTVGLRAFRSIDRMVGVEKLAVADAARLVLGEEAARWFDVALKIAKPTPGTLGAPIAAE
jgi:hypothetical protein